MDDGKRELKRCPICGSLPRYWQWNHGAIVECWCKDHRIQCEGKTLEEAVEAWERRADVEPVRRWIPVTERMPEEDYETGTGVQFSADVLATIVNHANDGELYVWLLKTVDGKWYDYVPNKDGTHKIPYWCEVIAWMPLPEPYKDGEQNG